MGTKEYFRITTMLYLIMAKLCDGWLAWVWLAIACINMGLMGMELYRDIRDER